MSIYVRASCCHNLRGSMNAIVSQYTSAFPCSVVEPMGYLSLFEKQSTCLCQRRIDVDDLADIETKKQLILQFVNSFKVLLRDRF